MKKIAICLTLWHLIFVFGVAPSLALQDPNGKIKNTGKSGTKKGGARSGERTGRPGDKSGVKAATNSALTGELILKTNLAGCAVSLDNGSQGKTGQDGTLNIPKLKPGSHTLVVTKAGYQKYQSVVELSAGQRQEVEVALAPLPVELNVSVKTPGAKIQIADQIFDGSAQISLAPGTYEVKVTKPGYRTVTQEVQLRPAARPETISVAMERVPLEELLAQAEQDFKTQRYDQVIAACLDVISAQPDHPRAVLLLGQSYFIKENHDDSVFYLVKAARLGEQATLPVKHHHSYGFCSGQLIIRKDLFGFRADDGEHSFGAAWAKVYELSSESYRGVQRLHTRVSVPKGRKESKQDFNFFAAKSTTTSSGIQCQGCGPAVDAIYQILQQLRK